MSLVLLTSLFSLKRRCLLLLNADGSNLYLLSIFCTLKKRIVCLIKHMVINTFKSDLFFVEVREGIGGIESEQFCSLLYRMYVRYFDRKGAVYEVVYLKGSIDNCKRVILRVRAAGLFKVLSLESGVHRIQRVPKTERTGRVHTSTCIVEVFMATPCQSVTLNRREVRVETFKARGPGGQSVNKTNSAVRIIHIPTGISVECQRERSQADNKKIAFALLNAKLAFRIQQQSAIAREASRNSNKLAYSTRAAKVRTYNFVRGVIVNHINDRKTTKLKEVLYSGCIDLIT